MADYALWWANDRGDRLRPITDYLSFTYTKSMHSIGSFALTIPYEKSPTLANTPGQILTSQAAGLFPFGRDYQLQIYRKPFGSTGYDLDFFGLARAREIVTDGNGNTTLTIYGYDPMYLLAGRIVAYYTQSAQATMTDNAGDILKAVVTDNSSDDTDYGGGDASPTRVLTDLTVAANLGDGTSITKSFAWDNVLDALEEIHNASAAAGTAAYFAIQTTVGSDYRPDFLFYTATGQPGADRTDGPEFSFENGSLAHARYMEDYSNEITVAYATGQGTESTRQISKKTSSDNRHLLSRYNVREGVAYASNEKTSAGVDAAAYNLLNDNRPSELFEATLQDSARMRYQADWQQGDKVPVNFAGRQFDGIVRAVTVAINPSGEQIKARFEHGAFIGNPTERMVKRLKKLEKEYRKLMKAEDTMYKGAGSSVPTTTELPNEGMWFNYENGLTRRRYENFDGTNIRFVTVT